MTAFLISIMLFILPGESLKDEVAEYLKKKLAYYESFEFEIVKAPEKYESVEILNGDLEIDGGIVRLRGKFTTGRKTTTSYISVKVKLYRKVLTASRPINRGTGLNASFFTLEKMDVTALRGTPETDLEELSSLRLKTSLKVGDVLFKEMTERVPVISGGAQVKAHSISGGVDITIDAFARQDGAEGDIIRVVSRDKKIFKALVIDSQNVQILE